jgi:hypothetical protein
MKSEYQRFRPACVCNSEFWMMHFPSSAARSTTEPAPVVHSISRAHWICVYSRHLSTQAPGELIFLQHSRFTSRCQSVLRTRQATTPGALWRKKNTAAQQELRPPEVSPIVAFRSAKRAASPRFTTACLPPNRPTLGGRGSRRAVPPPQPNSVTSVASVVKKEYRGSAGASPSRSQPDCRVSLRETCRLTPLYHRLPSPEPPPLGGRGSRRAVPLPQPNSVTSGTSVVKKRIPRQQIPGRLNSSHCTEFTASSGPR